MWMSRTIDIGRPPAVPSTTHAASYKLRRSCTAFRGNGPAARPRLSAEAVRFCHFARLAERVRRARMLVVQKDRQLLPDRFTLHSDRLLEQMILHVLRQPAPQADDSFAQGVRE